MVKAEAKEWKEWANEHCTHLWKVFYVDSEGSTDVLDIHVAANSLEDAKELAKTWITETRLGEEDKTQITKMEQLEWVCLV